MTIFTTCPELNASTFSLVFVMVDFNIKLLFLYNGELYPGMLILKETLSPVFIIATGNKIRAKLVWRSRAIVVITPTI